MELICPPRGVGAYLVRPGPGRVSAHVMNELGVFGWALLRSAVAIAVPDLSCQ
jgi:hypothetical protein